MPEANLNELKEFIASRPAPTIIKPTVGRVVWYRPHPADNMVGNDGKQPLAAIVAHVWSDTCVNLMVIDANGVGCSRTSVLLHQDGNDRPASGFCEWMPYQKGKAAEENAKVA